MGASGLSCHGRDSNQGIFAGLYSRLSLKVCQLMSISAMW